MKLRALCFQALLLSLPWSAQAAHGLSVPSAETLWPQWQARMALQTTAVARPPSLWGVLDRSTQPRAAQGGALLGDYYFAQPALGHFRASSGLMFGSLGGAPSLTASGHRWGLQVQSLGATPTTADPLATVPYLGLGFTSAAWRNAWYLTADVGWVAEQPSALGGFSRALQGSLAWEQALRDVRLAPVVQLGVRLSF